MYPGQTVSLNGYFKLYPSMEVKDAWDSEGHFNESLVLPGAYMTTRTDSGMMIQPDRQIAGSRDMDADSMSVMGEAHAHFEFPFYSTTETSWYSSSSEDMDGFYQLDQGNISHGHGHSHLQSFNVVNNIISTPQSTTLYRQTAFSSYITRPALSLSVQTDTHNVIKRCFKFLRKIHEQRMEFHRLTSNAASIPEHHELNAPVQNKAAFNHMIAERNRRVKIKHHFSLLHSLLPRGSKKDKYSVLSNTSKYMTELKHRVEQLEQMNRALEESLRINISKKEGSTSFEQRGAEHERTIVYSSDEVVVLGKSNKIPNEVEVRTNVQIDPLSNPTSLMIVLLEQLRELQLEVVAVETNVQQFNLEARILITQKGDEWENSKWEKVTELVRRSRVVH